METTPLSDADLDRMAVQVDDQLRSLRAAPSAITRGFAKGADQESVPDPTAQRKVVEDATNEPFETIWQKYSRHFQQDLCLDGGTLHAQWKNFNDVESKTVVSLSYGWLVAMGVAPIWLAPAAIAITVVALNTALNVGINVYCEDCVQEAARKAPEKKPKA